MLYDYVWVKNEETYKLWQKVVNGLVIGCIGVVLMLTPWTFVEGIVFDTRSVLLSVSGLFFGTIPTIIAMFITGFYRVMLGGGGMWMGIAVIVTSGLIGIIWRQFNPVTQKKSYLLQLYLMGLIVHAVMLGCTIFLPSDRMLETLKEIAVTVILVYPAYTLLLGMLMMNRNKKWQIRRALKESQEKYKRLYESIKDAYIMLDLSGNIIEANPSFLKMLGYSNEELITLGNKDITPTEWVHTESIMLDQYLIETDSSPIYEKEYIRKDGTKLPVQLHTFILKDDQGNAKAMWSIVRDISESKIYEQKLIIAREKAEENDKLKTIFLANMSHEIRTPMNAIMGFSGLLADPGNPPEKINKYVEIIKSSGSHLMNLIEDIIDISKIESRQLKLENKLFFPKDHW